MVRNLIVSGKESIFQFSAENELIRLSEPEEKLLIADSWLVNDGRVRALHLHCQRFLSSCHQLAGIDPEMITAFWDQAIGKLPKAGSWFPRIELAGSLQQPVFQFRLRKAPDLRTDIRLINCGLKDFRKMPRHKGPDLAELISARKKVMARGAEEAILTTQTGLLLEGLTTSIMWWEGKTLCTTSPSRRVLPGITCQLLRLIAEQENVPFAYRSCKPVDLDGCEVWAVNALHGIRRAVNWEKSPFRTSSHIDVDQWRIKLDRFIRPV